MSSGFSRMELSRTFGLLELENGGLTVTYTTFVGLLGHKRLDDDERLDDGKRLDDDERLDEFELSR